MDDSIIKMLQTRTESIFTYWFKLCYCFFKILYFTVFSFNFFLSTRINLYVNSFIFKM